MKTKLHKNKIIADNLFFKTQKKFNRKNAAALRKSTLICSMTGYTSVLPYDKSEDEILQNRA